MQAGGWKGRYDGVDEEGCSHEAGSDRPRRGVQARPVLAISRCPDPPPWLPAGYGRLPAPETPALDAEPVKPWMNEMPMFRHHTG